MTTAGLIENICTLLLTVACVLGLYYMSHSWHSFWAFLLLLNMNYVKSPKSDAS